MGRATQFIVCAAFMVLLAACTRGPDEKSVGRDVQAKLDTLFGGHVLALQSLRRQGSAPYQPAGDGTRQVVVYYNAIFRLVAAYDPSDWQGLSPTMIASTLGASDDGLIGLRSGRNEPGTVLRAYGSVVYRREASGWRPAAVVVPPAAPVETATGNVPKSAADDLVRRLADLVQPARALRGADEAIIAEELDHAIANIRLRLDRKGEKVVVATGPAGGEYSRFFVSLTSRAGQPGPISMAETAGSVENALRLERDDARLGFVQSDVAAAAVTGGGAFVGTGPLTHLRAVASLFPEPLHVVVRADDGIASLRDLAGRRVVLGGLGSGTRQTALRLLASAGVPLDGFTPVEEPTPQDALDKLVAGEVDAVIDVVSAPWRQLEVALQTHRLELLPLDAETIADLTAGVHGLVRLDIPARTYRGQASAVPTVAATALLVARDDVPDSIVQSVLELLYAFAASGGSGVQATRLSRARATVGITIPMHPAASKFFGMSPGAELTDPLSSGVAVGGRSHSGNGGPSSAYAE